MSPKEVFVAARPEPGRRLKHGRRLRTVRREVPDMWRLSCKGLPLHVLWG